jgi:LysM domain
MNTSEPPPFLSHRTTEPGQGLAGSAADRLAGGPQRDAEAAPVERARLDTDEPRVADRAHPYDDRDREEEPPRRPARRPRAYEQHLGGTDGPDWERPRRYEAYPTIKTGMAMPNLSRLTVMALAIGVAAVALFFLPAILGIGGGGSPAASVRPSVGAPSASLAPTEPPAPTPFLYTIKKNDTLSKIATAHGITVDELRAANPQIKNPDRIVEGQQITIPTPSAAPPEEIGGSAEPSAAP